MVAVRSFIVTLLCAQSVSGTVIHVTRDNYQKTIETTTLPVIIDVYATWCQPCSLFKPIFETFAQKHAGKYCCADVNYDESSDLAKSLGVTALPTLVVIKNKQVVGKFSGLFDAETLTAKIEEALKNAGKKLSELPKETLSEKFNEALRTGAPASEIRSLLAAGIDANEPLKDGARPIFIAINNALALDEGLEVLKVLLEFGASTKDIKLPGMKDPLEAQDIVKMMLVNTKKSVEQMHKIIEVLEQSVSK